MKSLIIFLITAVTLQSAYTQVKYKEVKNAQDVIDNFITALGGREKISSIRSETMTGDLNVQGMEIGFFVFRNDTMNFAQAEGSVNGSSMLLMKQITTKTFAWEYQMNSMRDFQGEELVSKQLDLITSGIGFVLNYSDLGFEFELKGTDTINGKLNYRLDLSREGKLVRTNYYDQENFYLTETVKPDDTVIEISDYRNVSGIYRPFKIIQKSRMEVTIIFKEYIFNKMIDESLLSKPDEN